jgi:hypothetical protein
MTLSLALTIAGRANRGGTLLRSVRQKKRTPHIHDIRQGIVTSPRHRHRHHHRLHPRNHHRTSHRRPKSCSKVAMKPGPWR